MYAIDDLSDAIDVSRDFLTPVTTGKWLRLLVVVFFLGGGGSLFTNFSTPPGGIDDGTGTTAAELPSLGFWEIVIIVAIVLLFVLIGLVFYYISSLMQFVFVESLGESEVHIRRYGKANLRNAAHLLVFEVGLGLAALLLVGLPALAIYFSMGFADAAIALFVVLGLFAAGLFLVYSVVTSLTVNFVVPIMLVEPVGILEGWKRFWPTLRGEWKEYVVYYLLAVVLRMVVGMGVGFLMLILGLVIGIPFLIVVFILFLIPVLGWILAILLIILGVILTVAFGALIQVPIETYFRYYALLVLGDTNDRFDLIPDQRAAVRADGVGEEPADEWADSGWDTDESASETDGDEDDEWGTDETGRGDTWDSDERDDSEGDDTWSSERSDDSSADDGDEDGANR